MTENIQFLILRLVEDGEPISSLFQWGYSYSSIINWFYDLCEREYLFKDDGIYYLTDLGKKELKRLEKIRKRSPLSRLERYRIPKLGLEDVYLP